MNNAVFGKTMENVRKHRDIKLVTTERRRNYLVSEPNYHTTKVFAEHLLAIEMKKILMNKTVYLGLSILELSKILMYEFWYDYVKPKYGKKAKLCWKDTDSFIVYIKTDDIYKDIAVNVETKLETWINVIKDESGGKIMTKLVELRGKTYRYSINDGNEDKKAKDTKKCVIKRKLKFENYKNCLEATQLENKINHLEKNVVKMIIKNS